MNQHRKGLHNQGGFSGYCCCPNCDYKIQHKPGMPCREMICPACKVSLEREDHLEKNSTNQNHKNMEYPKVDPEVCTGCGACMEVCPVNAIMIENGVAKIVEDKCRGCYACQNVCPVGAIS